MVKITDDFIKSGLRNGLLIRPKSKNSPASENLVKAASIELANYGFIVNPDDMMGMSTTALKNTIKNAREVCGADRDTTPVYKNFPHGVEEMDTLTLFVEQILHYWTSGAFLPDYPEEVREALSIEDMVRGARELKVVYSTEMDIARMLVTNKIAMSESDVRLLHGAIDASQISMEDLVSIVRDAVKSENAHHLIVKVKDKMDRNDLIANLAPEMKTINDLLHLVVTVAGESEIGRSDDYNKAVKYLKDSSASAIRFKNVNRKARKAVVKRLGEISKDFKADSLVEHKRMWRRVSKMLHAFDHVKNNAPAKRALDIIHDNIAYKTLNSQIEKAFDDKDVVSAVDLYSTYRPSHLYAKITQIARMMSKDNRGHVSLLTDAIESNASKASLSQLIMAYNGLLNANSDSPVLTRVAGENNVLRNANQVKISDRVLRTILGSIENAVVVRLSTMDAPTGIVGVSSDDPVPLVARDLSVADRAMSRGERIPLGDDGNILRVFGHWNNNMFKSGYMDIGAVVLNENINRIGTCTWNSWNECDTREWSTYSGDKCVSPGGSAAEFVDVKIDKLRVLHPSAKYVALTVQSWSGFKIKDVDFIAGAMVRVDGQKGKVFDPRSVIASAKPTTEALSAVPLVVDLDTMEMIWIDSSSGSTMAGQSARNDITVDYVVREEIERERMSMGKLATLWAKAHNVETSDDTVDKTALMSLF